MADGPSMGSVLRSASPDFWDTVGRDYMPPVKYNDAAPYIDDPSKTAWVAGGTTGGATLGALMGRGWGRVLSTGLGAGLGSIAGLATSGITTGPRIPHQGEGPREYLPDSNAVVPKLSYSPQNPIKPPGTLSPLYQRTDEAATWMGNKARDVANYMPDLPSGDGLGIMRGAQALTRGLTPMLAESVPSTISSVLKTASMPIDAVRKNEIDATGGDVLTTALLGAAPIARSVMTTAREARQLQDRMRNYRQMSDDIRLDAGWINAAKPLSTTGASLSENTAKPDSGLFRYVMYRDGKPFGYASGMIIGDKAHIGWIGDRKMKANTIGVSGIRQLREQIRKDFPQAKTFSGSRISGARQGPAARPDADPRQSVYLPSWLMPVAGVGAGLSVMGDDAYP